MVWINDHSFSHGACQCAWGGVKDSGLGRSHSKFGFYECVNIKMNAWEPGLTRDFWWHPYDRTLGEAVQASARILYGKGETRTPGPARGRRPAAEGRPAQLKKRRRLRGRRGRYSRQDSPFVSGDRDAVSGAEVLAHLPGSEVVPSRPAALHRVRGEATKLRSRSTSFLPPRFP